MDEAAQKARSVAKLVRKIKPDTAVYLEGGPILTAEDFNFVIRYAEIDGYVGGSTIDRFPVQTSAANQIAEYKAAAEFIGTRTKWQLDSVAQSGRNRDCFSELSAYAQIVAKKIFKTAYECPGLLGWWRSHAVFENPDSVAL